MAPLRPEEFTLPARFLCKTAHLIAVLNVVFDIDRIISNMTGVNPDTSTNPGDISHYDDRKQLISGLCYGAFACFGIEYITLFLGISMFFPPVMALNVGLHFAGVILVALWTTDSWGYEPFIAFFVVFNAFPAVLELLMFAFVTKFSFLKF